MKTLIILMLLISLGACKKSKDSGSSENPTPPPNNPTPEEPTEPVIPPPAISEITSIQRVHSSGSEVEFVVMFSKAVEVSQTPFLSLDVGGETRQAHFRRGAGESGKDISFFYEVQSNDNDDDGITLASHEINLNGGSIQDTSGQGLVNTIPQEYQNFPDVKVDTILPMIESIAKASGSSSGGTVDFVVTFNEPVKVKGVPALTLSLVGSTARATYEDTGDSSPTHTFRYTVEDGQSGAVQVTGIELDSSNGISDEAENELGDNISSPLHIRGVNIQASGTCSNAADSSGFNGGDGSASTPYLICTYTQLNKMRDSLTSHYELGQNINADESWGAGADGCANYDGSTVPETNACTGWVPIGAAEPSKCDGEADDECFQGQLDGAGYAISNLYFRILSSSVNDKQQFGFFSRSGSNAKISHVGLVDINIGAKHTSSRSDLTGYSAFRVGGLVGANRGSISNSYTTGNVFANHSNDFSTAAGGLAGSNEGTISNSYATGNISSSCNTYNYSGGLAGSNAGNISNSYATGNTSSSALQSNSGGLVGYQSNNGTISDSYTTGNVSSTSTSSTAHSGGLLGHQYNGTISNSYTTGTVSSTSTSGTARSGGLVGYYNSGIIRRTNYFVDSSGTNGLGSGTCSETTCTQKTLAELQALTSVTDWSTDDWDFGTTTQLPRVKYAPTATYCSDDTYTTQETCEDASETWVIEGCGGDTGVTCGDVIPGQ